MATFITLKRGEQDALPERFRSDDVRSAPELVRYILETYTNAGGVVLDPFAGFGTTLCVAEEMGRIGYGVEFLPERAEHIRSLIENKEHVLCGSSLELGALPLPMIDFSFTSPPYMCKNDHEQYPFAAYAVTGDGYGEYLRDIGRVYRQMKKILKPGARVVLEISNIVSGDVVTPLAWDVAASVGEVLTLERELIVAWEKGYGFGYDHCYCLVFRNE